MITIVVMTAICGILVILLWPFGKYNWLTNATARIWAKSILITANTKIEVYNIMGQFIGTGNQVEVPAQGIYLVRTENSPVQKILVK